MFAPFVPSLSVSSGISKRYKTIVFLFLVFFPESLREKNDHALFLPVFLPEYLRENAILVCFLLILKRTSSVNLHMHRTCLIKLCSNNAEQNLPTFRAGLCACLRASPQAASALSLMTRSAPAVALLTIWSCWRSYPVGCGLLSKFCGAWPVTRCLRHSPASMLLARAGALLYMRFQITFSKTLV